jgi:4-carboxymuconolactone decarboxylase
MTRIAFIDRADMDEEQGRAWDTALATSGVVVGPFSAYIRLPKLFEAAQHIRSCLYAGPLSDRERQIVHVLVARNFGAEYPWYSQTQGALRAGLDRAFIDAINARRVPDLPDPRERTCYEVARELLETRTLSAESYATAEKILGTNDLIALVVTAGNFSTVCLAANAFDMDPPAANPIPLEP